MAIADRATSEGSGNGASLTYAHTVAGTDSLAIWVCSNTFKSGAGNHPSTVTYAAVGLTALGSGITDADNRVRAWRLAAPATGANNVVLNTTAATDITGQSISYSGVDQTTPNDAVQELTSASTTPSHAITSETDDMVVDFAAGWNWAGAVATGGLTLRDEIDLNTGLNSIATGDAAGAASVTASWSFGAFYDDPFGLIGFNVNRATGILDAFQDDAFQDNPFQDPNFPKVPALHRGQYRRF